MVTRLRKPRYKRWGCPRWSLRSSRGSSRYGLGDLPFLGCELRTPASVLGAELELDFVASDFAFVNELYGAPLVIDGDPESDVVAVQFAVFNLGGSPGESVDGASDRGIALKRHFDRHVLIVVFERSGPRACHVGAKRNRGH